MLLTKHLVGINKWYYLIEGLNVFTKELTDIMIDLYSGIIPYMVITAG